MTRTCDCCLAPETPVNPLARRNAPGVCEDALVCEWQCQTTPAAAFAGAAIPKTDVPPFVAAGD